MKGWGFLLRVVIKAAVLFVVCNLVFALLDPLETLGRISIYNVIVPGRERLPYGENPTESYNLSINNLPALLSSHIVARPKPDDEYRVLLLGDSGSWGWRLQVADTTTSVITAANLKSADGRRVVVYNLAYPNASLMQNLLTLDYAMQFQPDQIVWLMTLYSFPPDRQIFTDLVENNPARVRALIERYNLQLDPLNPNFIVPDFWGKTIVGQRRALADWLRLQVYGFAWYATGIDHLLPDNFTPRRSDFDTDISWGRFAAPGLFTSADLSFDVLAAGVQLAGDVPIVIINEPIYISSGVNSDLRYDDYYPRWAYDEYRILLALQAAVRGWRYYDFWNRISPDEFTDTAVHMTAEGSRQFSVLLGNVMIETSSR